MFVFLMKGDIIHEIKFGTMIDNTSVLKTAVLNFGTRPEVWFKFPKSVLNDLTDRTDPWLNILIFPMMLVGGSFHIGGKVSKSLVENIEMFSTLWNVWFPNTYAPVKIISDVIADEYRPNNNKLISAFSGGVDGSYSAYKFKHHLNGRMVYDLDKSVFLLGADIPLRDRHNYEQAFLGAKCMMDDLGIELIPVETNYRECEVQNWEHEFGAVVSGALGFFAGAYPTTVAGSGGEPLGFDPMPWGMNPYTDVYLSSETCRYIVDGHEHTRTERVGFIKDWKAGIDNLRVCWRNTDQSKNCGVCEKCVRTKLNFLAHGVTHLPCMPHDFRFEDIAGDDIITKKLDVLFYEDILNYGKKHNTFSIEIINMLESRIEKWNQKFLESSIVRVKEEMETVKRKTSEEISALKEKVKAANKVSEDCKVKEKRSVVAAVADRKSVV